MRDILEKWIGTPYIHGGINRYGVDCTGFVQQFYKEIKVLKTIGNTKYSPSWFLHSEDEKILDGVIDATYEEGITIKETSLEYIKMGDLICFKNPRSLRVNHVGIFYEFGKFIHATEYLGVHVVSLFPFWVNKIVKIYTFERNQ